MKEKDLKINFKNKFKITLAQILLMNRNFTAAEIP